MSHELVLPLIFLISAFTMSFAGFGFALVSVPLLGIFLPIKVAVTLQFPYCLGLFMYQAWHYRAHFDWNQMRPLFLGTALGMPLGAYFLHNLPEATLKRALAIFIALVLVFNSLPASKFLMERVARNPWWGRACGFISGSFFGAYTIGGPPAAVYIMSVTNDPLKAKSFLASFFTIQFVLIGFVYGAAGMFSWQGLRTSLIFSPAVALGSLAGFWAFGKASPQLYCQVVALMLLLAAALLWWRA